MIIVKKQKQLIAQPIQEAEAGFTSRSFSEGWRQLHYCLLPTKLPLLMMKRLAAKFFIQPE